MKEDATVTVSKRTIYPYKVAVKQFESETTTIVFTLDSYKFDTVDLRDYKAFVFTSINGLTDITELPKVVQGNQMILTWVVGEYTLRYAGAITYQIVFKSDVDSKTAVFNTYEAILQCSESVDAERAIQAEYPTIFKQWYDLMQTLAGTFDAGVIYMPVGEPVPLEERLSGRLYYQVENATTHEGRFEDHNGKRLGEFNAKHVADPDFNTLLAHGEYFCVGGLNSGLHSPMNCQVAFLNVSDSGSANQQLQTFYGFYNNTIRIFVRSALNGGETFTSWQEVASTAYVDYAVSQVSGDITTHTTDNTVHITAAERSSWNSKAAGSHNHAISDVTNLQTTLNAKAPLASPAFTGTPTATTAATGTNNTQVATTAFVQNAISGKLNKTISGGGMVVVTDTNGNIITSTSITTTELNALNGYVSGSGSIETRLTNVENGSVNGLIGEIKWYAGSSVPTGYRLCNGAAVSRTTYSKLFAAIGTTWGVGDGSSTFNLPNLIGRVAWGANTAGGYKEAGLPNITGTFFSGGTESSKVSGAIEKLEEMMSYGTGGGYSDQDMEVKLDASKSSSIYGNSDTVQPPAANLMPIIKY